MQNPFFLTTKVSWLIATIGWLLVAAWSNPSIIAQQPDSAISVQPPAILHSDIPRTNCNRDTILLTNTNSSQTPIPVTVWLASSAENRTSSWSLSGITLDSLKQGVLNVFPRTQAPCIVQFCGVAPVGATIYDTLNVRWGNTGAIQIRTVPLQATITPVWNAPADTAFPNPVATGGRDSLTIVAVNRTNRPITINTARFDNPFGDQGFTILEPSGQAIINPQQSLPIRVRFTPNAQLQSPLQNTIIINERDTTELRINIQARTFSSPVVLQLSDTLLDFGAVKLGDCKRDTFTVSAGNTLFDIDSASIEGDRTPNDPRYQIISPTQFPVQNSSSIRFIVQFCPDSNSRNTDTIVRLTLWYRINGQSAENLKVELRGSLKIDSVASVPTILPMQLDFGKVNFDTCITDTITIIGDTIYQVIRAEFVRSNQNPDTRFILVEPQLLPQRIAPNGVRLVVRFCPDSTIADTVSMLLLSTNWSNTPITILLSGQGVQKPDPPIERSTIKFSTTKGQAGTTFELPIALSVPIRMDQNVSSLFFRMRMPARALYPVKVVTATGTIIPYNYRVEYAADTAIGTLTVNIVAGIIGQTIARIELLGFTTGYPETVVLIDSVAVGSSVVVVDTASGIVELEGCEIGKGISFTKRARITSVRPSPITEASTIHYIAPDGVQSVLRLIDLVGGVTRTMELPIGTGREELYRPDLHGLAPGIYLLELHVGSERNVIPIIIAEGGG